MTSHFSKYPLEKLVTHASVEPGYAFKSERFTENPTDIALVKGENVQQGFIDWSASKYWSISEASALEKYRLKVGDVVLAMDRPWVTSGLKWAYIKPNDPESLLVQRVSRLRGKKKLDQTYLRCLISSSYFSSYIQPIVTGVNVPHISGKQIGDFRIPLPAVETQQKIAAILSSYDDLIDNNRRRIALLEQMAEEIYREWFVRLRFPGHEQTKFEKGMPEGWRYVELGNICSLIKRGIAPNYTDTAGAVIINQRCIRQGVVDMGEARRHETKIPREKLIQYGDVLINSTGVGTLGRVAVFDHEDSGVTCDTHVTICRADINFVSLYYLGHTVRSLQTYFENMAVGSTGQSELGRDQIARAKILLPSDEVQKRFADIVATMWQSKRLLVRKIKAFTETRDALLPRLISGKLAVDDLDIRFPPGMAEASDHAI